MILVISDRMTVIVTGVIEDEFYMVRDKGARIKSDRNPGKKPQSDCGP